MTEYSIEYAHIYTDQRYSDEQKRSVNRLLETELRILALGKTTKRCVLIDDYSPGIGIERFDIKSFLAKLRSQNALPDVIVLESSLVPFCVQILNWLPDGKTKRQLVRYVDSRGMYPCSLFIAAWYLVRLGAFAGQDQKVECLYGLPDDLYGAKLVSILPENFRTPEETALEIIKQTPHAPLIKSITQAFFEDPSRRYSAWDDFDTADYFLHNYGRGILPEDREIIRYGAKALVALGLKPNQLKTVVDVGAAPNFYPAMLLMPFTNPNAKLTLLEYAQPNLDYLHKIFSDPRSKEGRKVRDCWLAFEAEMVSRNPAYHGAYDKLLPICQEVRGNIFELPARAYDGAISFFVAESITDDYEHFKSATRSLIGSVKKGGLILAAYATGLKHYYADERAPFPATNVSLDNLRDIYKTATDFEITPIHTDIERKTRAVHKGMALVVAKKTN